MATANNTMRTRIQLKSDTETNWRKSVLTTDHPLGTKVSGTSFVPLLGELIVYLADDTHPFSRLKIGDGETNVIALPFIDAGTVNGDIIPTEEVRIYAERGFFPSPGETQKLYVAYDTQRIYCYDDSSGYTLLSNFTYTPGTTTVTQITNWNAGTTSKVTESGGVINFKNGSLPTLNYNSKDVINRLTKEE